jgi:Tfp pilus assembly protein PilP
MQTLTKQFVVLSVLATLAIAQAKPAPKAPPAKPVPASQQVLPAASKPMPAKPLPAAAKPVAKQATATAKPAPAKPQPNVAATNAAAKPAAKAPVKVSSAVANRNKRDPFMSPVRIQEDKLRGNPACTTGARCLQIAQVVLKGVVKTPSGMIAMVENAAKKQYNLREKDPVFNGFVLKITGDSIVFRETTTDMLGNSTSREVVKRVTAPVV